MKGGGQGGGGAVRGVGMLLMSSSLLFNGVTAGVLRTTSCRICFRGSLFNVRDLVVGLGPGVVVLSIVIKRRGDLREVGSVQLTTRSVPVVFMSSSDKIRARRRTVAGKTIMCLRGPFDGRGLLL